MYLFLEYPTRKQLQQPITPTIAYTNKFRPMQMIYRGKTQRSYTSFAFLDSFPLSCNSKYFINTREPVKHIEEIILLYSEKEQVKLKLKSNNGGLY